jgi:Ulp1 family protease
MSLFVVGCRFDCGFYAILYMEFFNGKIMSDIESGSVPNFRKLLAASLVETRDNHEDNVEEIMKEDLQCL